MFVATCGYLSGMFSFLLVTNRTQTTRLKATKIINKLLLHFGFLRLTLVATSIKKLNISKNKFHPKTGHEDTEREYSYSSTLSLTSVLDASGWSTPTPGSFTPEREVPYLMYRAGWAPGLDWADFETKKSLAPPRVTALIRPARSGSLYRQHYPCPTMAL